MISSSASLHVLHLFLIAGLTFPFSGFSQKTRRAGIPFAATHISTVKYPDVLVVVSGCHEPPDSLNPPAGLYRVVRVYCNESTNNIDARESGIMLRFVIEHYWKIRERKVFFIHNHDKAWHVPRGSVWEDIAQAVNAPTFWTNDFGLLANVLNNHFPPGVPEARWIRYGGVIPWLFQGTSMTEWLGKSWDMPCCATFWLNSELMWQRPKRDYVRLLANINTLAKAGFCAVFNWTVCNEPNFQQNHRGEGASSDNYVLGQVMEVVWGVLLANRSNVN
jgi:hypothetical protein